jgi:glycine C-acetyltransferase
MRKTIKPAPEFRGGENFDLRQMLIAGKRMNLKDRVAFFHAFLRDLDLRGERLWMRRVVSVADRHVMVEDPVTGETHPMLMFGSNNYLGLANHPYVREQAARAIQEHGAGIGGPPLLNGYTNLHAELEERMAGMKGSESALLFSSGYNANVGMVAGLSQHRDCVLYDAYSHASFCDGIRLSGAPSFHFAHNSVTALNSLLERESTRVDGDLFVGVEGLYSMDGDLAPLDQIVPLCSRYGATLILDDAHGTGVMGEQGRGTAEHFGLEGEIPLTMGTFSKTFAVAGGFVSGPKPIVDYLRYFARSYMFSASLPPVVVATVLAGMDVIEHETWLIQELRTNVGYATENLQRIGFDLSPYGAIIPLRVPGWMNIRKASRMLHERGIFVNSIEFPAVPKSEQRFRISIMATHSREDIDRLVEAIQDVWTTLADTQIRETSSVEGCAA